MLGVGDGAAELLGRGIGEMDQDLCSAAPGDRGLVADPFPHCGWSDLKQARKVCGEQTMAVKYGTKVRGRVGHGEGP